MVPEYNTKSRSGGLGGILAGAGSMARAGLVALATTIYSTGCYQPPSVCHFNDFATDASARKERTLWQGDVDGKKATLMAHFSDLSGACDVYSAFGQPWTMNLDSTSEVLEVRSSDGTRTTYIDLDGDGRLRECTGDVVIERKEDTLTVFAGVDTRYGYFLSGVRVIVMGRNTGSLGMEIYECTRDKSCSAFDRDQLDKGKARFGAASDEYGAMRASIRDRIMKE